MNFIRSFRQLAKCKLPVERTTADDRLCRRRQTKRVYLLRLLIFEFDSALDASPGVEECFPKDYVEEELVAATNEICAYQEQYANDKTDRKLRRKEGERQIKLSTLLLKF